MIGHYYLVLECNRKLLQLWRNFCLLPCLVGTAHQKTPGVYDCANDAGIFTDFYTRASCSKWIVEAGNSIKNSVKSAFMGAVMFSRALKL